MSAEPRLPAPLLSVQGVSVRFGGIVALDGISFDVAAGQICGLIGPNGAGKTTLFNCLSRLYTPHQGAIRFDGRPLLTESRHRIARIGIARTFQNLALFRTMSVIENVMIGAHSRARGGFLADALALPSVAREERRLRAGAMALVEEFGLGGVAGAPVSALPFGTQKRVELARALASEPRLLLLDEPAGGLNHEEVDQLRRGDPRHPRPAQGDGAAGRASHEPRHARLRPGRRAQFRPQDRRRAAGRGAARRRGHPRLSRRRGLMAALLETRGLKAFYGPIEVLHGLDLAVEAGGITALLGANGAGKTTTLRALCAMVRRQGEIRFSGAPVVARQTEDVVRLGIAHVPDGRGTFVDLTVEENLRLGAYTRVDRGRVRADFARVYAYFPRLAERRAQQAGTLSGGEQQMLAISRALMLRPKLLLLDEPSFGLAPIIVKDIFRILRAINREDGVSMLIVEQNANLALDLADHAYLIETGRVAIGGPAAMIRNDDAVRRSYLGY